MKKLLLLMALAFAGCGGSSTSNLTDSPLPGEQKVFPPFTSVRSDYLNTSEGTIQSPLNIDPTLCTYLPAANWQEWLCSKSVSMAVVYPASNGFSHTPDNYYSWVIVSNNEPIQSQICNSGPPNQSQPINQQNFHYFAQTSSLQLRTNNDECGKLPYMSASYTRGTQKGDSKANLYTWAELQKRDLILAVNHYREPGKAAWHQVYMHFRDSSGKRYMVLKELVTPEVYPSLKLNWNWPYTNSFQFPGAIIAILPADPKNNISTGDTILNLNISQLALQAFPEFESLKPDFLGIEIGIESSGPQQLSTEIKKIDFLLR